MKRGKRYDLSARGRVKRELWHASHKAQRTDAVRRYRERMKAQEEIGAALQARFPDFTTSGTGGVGPDGPPRAAGDAPIGTDRSALRSPAAHSPTILDAPFIGRKHARKR